MKEQVNSAYDLSLFEAAPELEPKKHPKKNNVIVLPKEKIDKEARRRHNIFYVAAISIFVVIFTAISITIVQSNVLINELNTQIVAAENEISILEEKIESYAESNLGMTKADNMQKEFITMSGEDKAEILQGNAPKNVFETIADAFTSLWS